jgi:hypothetical protein
MPKPAKYNFAGKCVPKHSLGTSDSRVITKKPGGLLEAPGFLVTQYVWA